MEACAVAFFGMLCRECHFNGNSSIFEHIIRHSAAEYAAQKSDGNLTRLSPLG